MKLAVSARYEVGGDLIVALEGAAGMLAHDDAPYQGRFQDLFMSQWAPRIGGGTDQVQRNIIGERVLGPARRHPAGQARPVPGPPQGLTRFTNVPFCSSMIASGAILDEQNGIWGVPGSYAWRVPLDPHRPSADSPSADLDHAATTRLRPEARAAMEPFLGNRYGNPSGSHALARDAVRAVDEAREQVADLIGCRPGEVVFTSGGTESDNHAVTGGVPTRHGVPVCSAVEHPAVLDVVRVLGGVTVAVDATGRIDLDALADVIDQQRSGGRSVGVVSVMTVNNELGTIDRPGAGGRRGRPALAGRRPAHRCRPGRARGSTSRR